MVSDCKTDYMSLMILLRDNSLHRPRESVLKRWFYKVIEKWYVSDLKNKSFSIVYRKTDCLEVLFYSVTVFFKIVFYE